MRSLFSAALSLHSVDITIDSATWTVFPILQQQKRDRRLRSSSRSHCTKLHELTRDDSGNDCMFFFSSFVFHARVHQHLFIFIPATLHDIAQHRCAACSSQHPLKANFFTILFLFSNDLPFWESQIRCLFSLLRCFDASMSRDYRVRFDSVPCNDSPSSLWVSLVRNVLLFQLNLECFHVYISFFFVVKRIQLRSGKWWLRTIDHINFFHRRPNAHALHIFKRQIRVRRQFPLCICIVQTEKCGHCSYNYTSAPSTNHSLQTTISEIETITHFAK